MKYSIGYQFPDAFTSVPEICKEYSDKISNVYFSFCSEQSGRLPLCSNAEKERDLAEKLQLAELKEIKALGKSLTLLLRSRRFEHGKVPLAAF